MRAWKNIIQTGVWIQPLEIKVVKLTLEGSRTCSQYIFSLWTISVKELSLHFSKKSPNGNFLGLSITFISKDSLCPLVSFLVKGPRRSIILDLVLQEYPKVLLQAELISVNSAQKKNVMPCDQEDCFLPDSVGF